MKSDGTLNETGYLLKNKQDHECLNESIQQLQNGNVKIFTLDDWKNLKNTWNINE